MRKSEMLAKRARNVLRNAGPHREHSHRQGEALSIGAHTFTSSTRRPPPPPPLAGTARNNYGYPRPQAISLHEALEWSDDAYRNAWARQA